MLAPQRRDIARKPSEADVIAFVQTHQGEETAGRRALPCSHRLQLSTEIRRGFEQSSRIALKLANQSLRTTTTPAMMSCRQRFSPSTSDTSKIGGKNQLT